MEDWKKNNEKGQQRKIQGSMLWTYGNTTKGTGDIHAILGNFIPVRPLRKFFALSKIFMLALLLISCHSRLKKIILRNANAKELQFCVIADSLIKYGSKSGIYLIEKDTIYFERCR